MKDPKLDILVFGAHPDDAELGCGGTIALHTASGYRVGVVDLSRGELGTRGTPREREQEATEAARILGLSCRINLGLPDGGIRNTVEQRHHLMVALRRLRPEIVLANAPSDRHPEHGQASALAREACFYSGLVKIRTKFEGSEQAPWRPRALYFYVQDRYLDPDLLVDISAFMEKKMEAVQAFKSQFFDPGSKEPESPISSRDFLESVRAKASVYGRLMQVSYAEGFRAERPLGTQDLLGLI